MDTDRSPDWNQMSPEKMNQYAGEGLQWLQDLPDKEIDISFEGRLWTIRVSINLEGLAVSVRGDSPFMHLAVDQVRQRLNPILRAVAAGLAWTPTIT